MKKQFYTMIGIAMILNGYSVQAQNIDNPGFETYSSCPTGQTPIARATGWRRPTGGTSDYFNDCGYNISGTLSPEDGAGFVCG